MCNHSPLFWILIGSAINCLFWLIVGLIAFYSFLKKKPNDGIIVSDNPLKFVILNSTDKYKTARLFGYSAFYHSKVNNLGSDEGITISNDSFDSHYAEAVSESAFEPFEITFLRLFSENRLQLTRKINVVTHKACSKRYERLINTFDNYEDKLTTGKLIDKRINEFDCKIKINHSVYLEIEILPNTQLNVFVFRKRVIRKSN